MQRLKELIADNYTETIHQDLNKGDKSLLYNLIMGKGIKQLNNLTDFEIVTEAIELGLVDFKSMSVSEFNNIFETKLKKYYTFSQVVDEIEREEINYFYVSPFKGDVIREIYIKKEELIKQLNLWLIYIEQVGVYIAIKQ